MTEDVVIDRLIAEDFVMVDDYRLCNSWEICDTKVILSAKLSGRQMIEALAILRSFQVPSMGSRCPDRNLGTDKTIPSRQRSPWMTAIPHHLAELPIEEAHSSFSVSALCHMAA